MTMPGSTKGTGPPAKLTMNILGHVTYGKPLQSCLEVRNDVVSKLVSLSFCALANLDTEGCTATCSKQ